MTDNVPSHKLFWPLASRAKNMTLVFGIIQLFGREYSLILMTFFAAKQLNNGFITVPIWFPLIKSVKLVVFLKEDEIFD